jgi:uncharacterized protein (TIGR01440 family)
MQTFTEQVSTIVEELILAGRLTEGQLLVVGASTSEVIGEHIGKHGSMDVAKALFDGIQQTRKKHGVAIAFQCCEHLNRALVIERSWFNHNPNCEEVRAIPVAKAGGSMAAYAYQHLDDPVLIESVKAQAGIDIGDTLIGMHLKAVAVPFRSSIRSIGQAHVTAAYTRPKLIGGQRAVYDLEIAKQAAQP